MHLVAIIVYSENTVLSKKSEAQIKAEIIDTIKQRSQRLDRKTFHCIGEMLLPRLNYILLPVWELEQLIQTFQQKLGL